MCHCPNEAKTWIWRFRQRKKRSNMGPHTGSAPCSVSVQYQQLLVEHWEELARLVTWRTVKATPKRTAKCYVASNASSSPQVPRQLMMGKQLPDIASNLESGMYRYPIGVIGGITPFNFPMMVPCWMFPLAIACGNTFVLKPSERTPLLANRLAELFHEAGLTGRRA